MNSASRRSPQPSRLERCPENDADLAISSLKSYPASIREISRGRLRDLVLELTLPSRRLSLGSGPRPKPQQIRSITVEQEGPNRPVEGRLIPRPEVPCYPVHGDLGLILPSGSARETPAEKGEELGLLGIGRPLFTTAGKAGIGWTFKALGLQPGDKVLMPAYHCMAMVEPLEWFGLEPLFYRLHEDLSIDYAGLEPQLDESCKALVAVHYFGFPQGGNRLRDFCDSFGLALIEDCCHSFFGSHGGQPMGTFGDYAVGSLPKFFPLQSGGCVVSRRREMPKQSLAAPGAIADLRMLVREWQTAHYYDRLSRLAPLTFAAAGLTKAFQIAGLGRDMAALQTLPHSLDFSASRFAANIARAGGLAGMAATRRRNYAQICRALADVPGLTLLKPELEPDVVPYMVPLRIPALRRLFARMEDLALPMQRFGQFLSPQLDETLCPVSSDLSHHGLQLPCHQSLLPEEIDWMVERLRELCRNLEPAVSAPSEGVSESARDRANL